VVVDEAAIVHHLLDAGLLSARHIIDGSLRITSAGGRNRTFEVKAGLKLAYLVKWARDGDESVVREAAVYRFLDGLADSNDLAQVLPTTVAWCHGGSMLVLEYVDGLDLRRHHARLGRCPLSVAAQCGTLLAAVHTLPTAAVPSALWSTLTADNGGLAAVHRPAEQIFATSSRAVVDLIALMQADRDLCTALDALADDWEPAAFTHDDVRWDNIVIAAKEAGAAPLRLVDWEAAGFGDPDWDVGCLFAEYLSHWLASIPLTTAATAADHIHLARYPLHEAQRAIQSAWACYVDQLGISAARRRNRLRRATRYVGSRLVQRALELDQQSTAMSVAAACHLQVAAQILADPDSAVTACWK